MDRQYDPSAPGKGCSAGQFYPSNRGLKPSLPARRIIHGGEYLVREGARLEQAFIIRMGHFKSYRLHRDGEKQILGIHGPGDVLGFEALVGGPSHCSHQALEMSTVELVTLSQQMRQLIESAGPIAELLSGIQAQCQRLSRLLYIDRHPADRRLAEFLIDFSHQEGATGRSAIELRLPLNRRDLARFLGLAPETLSRTLSRLQERRILQVDNREIRILDLEVLEQIAEDRA
jgi:CRP/FNR family transcriptional regulator